MNRIFWTLCMPFFWTLWTLGAVLALVLIVHPVRADNLPNGLTCEHVQRAVATLGKTQAYLIAVANGATRAQVAEARKCLDRKK